MMKARIFEFGIFGFTVLTFLLALVIGIQFSILYGVLVFITLTLGFFSLFYNFDYPLVRRMTEQDDQFILKLCNTGFVGRVRWILSKLPASPRCRFCFVPFGGLGRLVGIRPSAKNPNFCRSCFEGLPTKTYELEVGVLFADIRGFTSWTEGHQSGEAARALTRFYAIANEMLTSDDVFVEFVGDQVMAFYIVSMPSNGDRTSEIMLAAARRLIAAVREADDALPIGVGLNFGVAQVGPMTKGESRDFTAVGDVVNSAARLQSNAAEYQIVVSDSVHARLAELENPALATEFAVKGKELPLKAYLING